jgi:hypothetical protein
MAGPLGGDVGAREHPPHLRDIDGGPPRNHGLWQLLPPRLTKTSMACPLGVVAGSPSNGHHQS